MKCAWKELLAILPPWLRSEVDKQGRSTLQEIRLRRDQPVILIRSDGRVSLQRNPKQEDVQYVINAASHYSPWTATTTAQGYLTAPGGHRIGLCGEALVRNGIMDGFRTITSMNIRIARDFPGISSNLWLRNENILILGPPGCGKTTLLRDLIRQRSQRQNISVVDQREELFPSAASFEPGANTDVLTGCSKAQGVLQMLRVMSPECIAVDEITDREDCDVLRQAGWCGVSLLATAHAASVSDLYNRPIYTALAGSHLFETAVILRRDKSWYTERIDLCRQKFLELC